jgi:EAL domain-containing protein (putative c-di-GMP-specific phosphodiesterase class I)
MEQRTPADSDDASLIDFDAVCQKIRAAVEPARAHAISLHDASGEVLWLSESSMEPDARSAVRESVASFADVNGPPVIAINLDDSRSAVMLRAVDSRRSLAGIVMVILDSRAVPRDDGGALKRLTPRLQRVVSEFAAMRPASAAQPTRMRTAAAHSSSPPMTGDVEKLQDALRGSLISLYAQRLVPLSKDSRLQRYEVLLRSRSEDAPHAAPHAMLKSAVDTGLGSMIDRRVVTELIGWLLLHRDVWDKRPALFCVNLTATALHDEHFMKFLESCLAKSALPKSMIAFEVDVPTIVKSGDKILAVAAALHRLGCVMVLDDFAMRTECIELLRLPAVRYLKLAPHMTADVRTDRVSQASIAAVVQMARVLGMHTVAKRTENAAEQEWLTALGVDFIQSTTFSAPVPLDDLSRSATSTN